MVFEHPKAIYRRWRFRHILKGFTHVARSSANYYFFRRRPFFRCCTAKKRSGKKKNCSEWKIIHTQTSVLPVILFPTITSEIDFFTPFSGAHCMSTATAKENDASTWIEIYYSNEHFLHEAGRGKSFFSICWNFLYVLDNRRRALKQRQRLKILRAEHAREWTNKMKCWWTFLLQRVFDACHLRVTTDCVCDAVNMTGWW